jgi:hypothetical protein
MLPTFLGIGAQRCATTWMYECLREHPEIFMSPRKEVHFFDENYEKGIRWYEGFFESASDESGIGEITPEYIYARHAPELIRETIPDALLIACLRNPIDRAYSQYGLHLRGMKHSLSFEDALKAYPEYVERGFYLEQIRRYLGLFSDDNLLILIYEDLEQDPMSFIQTVYRFLDVRPDFLPSQLAQRRNRGVTRRSGLVIDAFRVLSNLALDNRLTRAFLDVVKKSNLVDTVLQELIFNMHTENIDAETRRKLREIFYRQNLELSNLLDRDLVRLWR